MALSDDLRERVVEAGVVGGLLSNAAAKRFGGSFASAVRWLSVSARAARFRRLRRAVIAGPADRGASRLSARSHSPPARPYAVGNPGATDCQLRRTFLLIGDLATFDWHEITFKERLARPLQGDLLSLAVDQSALTSSLKVLPPGQDGNSALQSSLRAATDAVF